LGFGYRAKYIATTARLIANEKSPDWLSNLRKVPYKEAHEELLSLSGVGPKVADCVCLMSMDKSEAVPVDTHGNKLSNLALKNIKILIKVWRILQFGRLQCVITTLGKER